MNDFIPVTDCVHGWLYYIKARNFRLGIYNEAEMEFIGIRTKFGQRYLSGEDHWDQGPPYGTVKPLKKLVKAPFARLTTGGPSDEAVASSIFGWLDERNKEFDAEMYPHIAPGHK